jgi:outer membrane protein assembly factor BamA
MGTVPPPAVAVLLASFIAVVSPGTAVLEAQAPDPVVTEPPITVMSVEVRGIEELSPPVRVPGRLPLRRGEPYTAERIEATELVLRRVLAESGHPYAAIEVAATVDEGAGTAAVVLEVEPGPRPVFGPVTIHAPAPLRESDIRPRVTFARGDLVRPSAVERTRRSILSLPGVDDVVVELPGLETGALTLPAVVRVTRPERMHDVSGRATLSSMECLELAGGWRHRHFLGAPRAFTVRGGFSNLFASVLNGGFPCGSAGEEHYAQANYSLATELYQPIAARRPTALEARAFFRRTTAPQSYLIHGFGLHLAGLREVGPGLTLRAGYAPERNELRAAGHYFCVNFGACSQAAIAGLSGPRWLAPLEAEVSWIPPAARQPFGGPAIREGGLWPGTLGPLWRPMLRLGAAGAGAATGSDFAYLRVVAEASVARVLTPRTEAAARVRAGGVTIGDDALPPQVRFYSGGANTVRGVAQNLMGPLVLVARPHEATDAGCDPVLGGCPAGATPDPDRVSVRPLGGTAVLEGNLELRLWLTPSVQLAAFADGGLLRGDPGPLSPSARSWEAMAAPGAGARWISPLGPLRVDVGYDARGPRRVPMLLRDDAAEDLITLGDVVWAPHTHDRPGPWLERWRRLQLHLAMGQSF